MYYSCAARKSGKKVLPFPVAQELEKAMVERINDGRVDWFFFLMLISQKERQKSKKVIKKKVVRRKWLMMNKQEVQKERRAPGYDSMIVSNFDSSIRFVSSR